MEAPNKTNELSSQNIPGSEVTLMWSEFTMNMTQIVRDTIKAQTMSHLFLQATKK